MEKVRKYIYPLLMVMMLVGFTACGSHPNIDTEKISTFSGKIDCVSDEYSITADDASDVVGQFQAVVDKIVEFGGIDNAYSEMGSQFPGNGSVIMSFANEMYGVSKKMKHNRDENDGLVWGDVKRLPFSSSQVDEIISQGERMEKAK